jgi:flagellar FliL protein
MAVGATKAVSDSDLQPKKSKSRIMPQDATEAVSDSDPQPEKGKNRKLLTIGAIATLLALGSSGAIYFYAHQPAADDNSAAGKVSLKPAEKVSPKPVEKAPQKIVEKVPRKPMIYVPMETFTVNLRNSVQERYLQVTMNLEVADNAAAESLKDQMPSIRNRVLLMLSSKEAEDLMTREGKEKLSAEVAAELRKLLDGTSPGKGLEQVLFSQFAIQ